MTPGTAPDQFDEEGNWTGTCPDCGTDHEGYPPDTLGAITRCLRIRARKLGAVHVEAGLDQLDAKVTEHRNDFIRRFLDSGREQ